MSFDSLWDIDCHIWNLLGLLIFHIMRTHYIGPVNSFFTIFFFSRFYFFFLMVRLYIFYSIQITREHRTVFPFATQQRNEEKTRGVESL